MTSLEHWPRVKLLLEGALACSGAERDAYLSGACGGDTALRAQVDALLAGQEAARDFLETPAMAQLEAQAASEDLSGRTVSWHRLVSRLGAGGMGEVYLAHDTKLDRPVAIKLLSADLAADQERLRRFHQEARAASSLNHPHIVVVHDFGELDGRPYIVTEFVEGQTLRQRLEQGPMTGREVGAIGAQIAGALAAAHARGLVHRDIKPENVMVRPDGYVKVLDFGLAKLASGHRPPEDAPDVSSTLPGVVIGTPRYMSPEQARGFDVDGRSDIWSLGVLLYEMAAGRPPFDGPSPADAVAAILGADPVPLDELAPQLPAALRTIVMKTLRKDRDDRYGDAASLAAALRRIATAVSSAPADAAGADGEDESPAPPAAERRRVAVLVSVVSDYGSLVERLASPDLEALIARIRAAAVDTARRHGGLVNQSIGEEIVTLFGIPAADEDDDLRAVRAALELHAQARELGRAAPGAPALCLQSGLHAGLAVVQRLREGPRRYAVTGPPAQAAARLAAAAGPDAILVSPDCHRLVAPFTRSEAREPVAMHASAAPVTPYRVLGESGRDNRLDALERGGLTPYSGRTAELRALEAHVDRIRHGEGSVVVIVGEVGSGKSRLLHELRARAGASGPRMLHGRCRPSGGMTSYSPFLEAMHGALDVKDAGEGGVTADRVAGRIREIEPSLEPLIPLYLHLLSLQSGLFPLPRHLRGEHYHAALLEALAAFFTSYAQRAPVWLVLEDWHWADDASRRALQHLAEVIRSYPLVVITTTRPEPGAIPDAGDAMHRIDLGPLPFSAALAIMQAVLVVERVPADLARRLHERTGGNPFFLEEMCQTLREAGDVTARGEEAVVTAPADVLSLPDSVQAVIRSRLDRLPPEGRQVVRVASVIGREFSRQILRETAGDADLAATLERLKKAGIVQQIRVVPDPLYRFRHVLTQEVAYESLLEHQRKALHQAVGTAIERHETGGFPQPLELLAHHFSHAGSWAQAVDYGSRAAERAMELSQFADALDMLDRVQSWLARLPDEPARRDRMADVLLRQERLCETLGMRGRQLQIGAELIALLAPDGGSVRLAEAYLRQGDVSTLLKRFDAADRALATSLRISRERGDAALERSALRSIGLLRWHQGRHDDALTITEHALAIDRQREDDLAVAGDLSNLGNILRSMGQHGRALAILEEALAMPVVASDPIKRAYILHVIANVHRAEGNVARALEYLQEADASARANMLPIQRSFHLTSIAHIHLQEGRLSESLRLYQEAVELSRRPRHANGLAQSLRMLGEVLFGIGREEEALPHLQEAAQLFAQLEDREGEAAVRQHAATILERNAQPGARAAWERVRALAQAAGDARAELAALEGVARTLRGSPGTTDAAVQRFEEALALASTIGDRGREASLHNTLAILHWERAAYADALAEYEAALGLTRALGDRRHEGLILNSLGVTLSRMHRYEEARTVLEDALAVNRATGERLLEAHTLASLADAALRLGRIEAAVAGFEQSLAIRRSLGDRRGEGWMLHHLAGARRLAGDAAGALAAAAAADRLASECGDMALREACRLAGGDADHTAID